MPPSAPRQLRSPTYTIRCRALPYLIGARHLIVYVGLLGYYYLVIIITESKLQSKALHSDELQPLTLTTSYHTGTSGESAESAEGIGMGLMSILKKMKQKEKDVRLLMLYPIILSVHLRWLYTVWLTVHIEAYTVG